MYVCMCTYTPGMLHGMAMATTLLTANNHDDGRWSSQGGGRSIRLLLSRRFIRGETCDSSRVLDADCRPIPLRYVYLMSLYDSILLLSYENEFVPKLWGLVASRDACCPGILHAFLYEMPGWFEERPVQQQAVHSQFRTTEGRQRIAVQSHGG